MAMIGARVSSSSLPFQCPCGHLFHFYPPIKPTWVPGGARVNALAGIYFISTGLIRRLRLRLGLIRRVSMPLRAFISFLQGDTITYYQPTERGVVSIPLRAFISFLQYDGAPNWYALAKFQCPCGHLFHFYWPDVRVPGNGQLGFQCPCGHLFHFYSSQSPDRPWPGGRFQCPCGHLFHFYRVQLSPRVRLNWWAFQCPCGHLFHFYCTTFLFCCQTSRPNRRNVTSEHACSKSLPKDGLASTTSKASLRVRARSKRQSKRFTSKRWAVSGPSLHFLRLFCHSVGRLGNSRPSQIALRRPSQPMPALFSPSDGPVSASATGGRGTFGRARRLFMSRLPLRPGVSPAASGPGPGPCSAPPRRRSCRPPGSTPARASSDPHAGRRTGTAP